MMTPDYEKAAIAATKTLIKYGVSTAPVSPVPILKRIPGVLVFSFSEISNWVDLERDHIKTLFGLEHQDAVTSVRVNDGKLQYLVAYNQLLPFNMIQRSLARELGHIVLGHDGSKPEDVRIMEAKCFSKHLLCPRALIHAIEEAGSKLTVEAVGCITGCYGRCQRFMRGLPGVSVPAELNRKVKAQFADYVSNFVDYQSILIKRDESPVADLGTYMDGYKE